MSRSSLTLRGFHILAYTCLTSSSGRVKDRPWLTTSAFLVVARVLVRRSSAVSMDRGVCSQLLTLRRLRSKLQTRKHSQPQSSCPEFEVGPRRPGMCSSVDLVMRGKLVRCAKGVVYYLCAKRERMVRGYDNNARSGRSRVRRSDRVLSKWYRVEPKQSLLCDAVASKLVATFAPVPTAQS